MAVAQLFSLRTSNGTTATNYKAIGAAEWQTTLVTCPWPIAGRFKHFGIRVITAPGASKTWTYELVQNGSTVLTLTITGTGTTVSDTVTEVVVVPGDNLYWKRTSSGSPTLANSILSLEFHGTVTGQSAYSTRQTLNSSSTIRGPVLFPFNWSGSSSVFNHEPIAVAGTITGQSLVASAAPASGSYQLALYKNGVKQDGTGGTVNTVMTISVGVTSASWSGSISVAAGDWIYQECVPSGSPAVVPDISLATVLVATTDGESQMSGLGGQLSTSGSAYVQPAHSHSTATWNFTEANAFSQHRSTNAFTLSGLRIRLSATVSTGPCTFAIRQNGVTSALAATLTSGQQTGADTTHSITLSATEEWAMQFTATGSPGTARNANFAFVCFRLADVLGYEAHVTQVAVEVAIATDLGISLTVDGVEQILDDVGIGLLRATLRLEENLTARTVMSFKLRDPTEIPEIEQTVLLTINGVRHFGGIVTTIVETPFGDGTIVYSLTCTDWLAVADGILINDISPAGTLRDVLEWMLTRLEEFGFSIHPLQDDGPTLEATAYPFQTYTQALTALATSIDRTWRVDAYQQLRVYPGEAGIMNENLLNNDIVFPNASREITRENHASTVWVRFGSGTASEVTITSPGAPGMVYTPPYIVAIGPNTVNVNGTDYPVLPAPGAGWRWDSSTGELTTDVALTGSDTVIYTVTVAWPSYAVASTVVGTDLYEVAVIVDYPNIFDAARASEIAIGELAKREGFPPIFHVTTVHPWFHAGELVTVDLPLYGFSGEGLLTGVRLQHVSRRGDTGAPWWQFDLDILTSTVIPRANWLDFWRGSTGGGAGATSVPPP